MPILQLPLGDDPDSDVSLDVYTLPSGTICLSLPDGWNGVWLKPGNARRLAEWLDEHAEV